MIRLLAQLLPSGERGGWSASTGPAQRLPDTTIGSLTPALYAEARKKNWTIISMKND
ncbi:hypothetical protein [Bradyrhizobium liaoningense]|uniref:hypothetical protein n=1 Tax=Bradyrhizobium liaoningense TaxID=43992 RepID=UPI00201182AE|nr:hypothetical protein [Bradyrhizobium liaoningense]